MTEAQKIRLGIVAVLAVGVMISLGIMTYTGCRNATGQRGLRGFAIPIGGGFYVEYDPYREDAEGKDCAPYSITARPWAPDAFGFNHMMPEGNIILNGLSVFAVENGVTFGKMENGSCFIVDTRELDPKGTYLNEDPKRFLFNNEAAWKQALEAKEISPETKLLSPEQVIADRPDREVRPWYYVIFNGFLGISDPHFMMLFLVWLFPLAFLFGGCFKIRAARGISTFILGIAATLLTEIHSPGYDLSFCAAPFMWWGVFYVIALVGASAVWGITLPKKQKEKLPPPPKSNVPLLLLCIIIGLGVIAAALCYFFSLMMLISDGPPEVNSAVVSGELIVGLFFLGLCVLLGFSLYKLSPKAAPQERQAAKVLYITLAVLSFLLLLNAVLF